MNNPDFSDFNMADSVLYIKASGSISDVSYDMNCPETKTIAQLLNEEKTKEDTESAT